MRRGRGRRVGVLGASRGGDSQTDPDVVSGTEDG